MWLAVSVAVLFLGLSGVQAAETLEPQLPQFATADGAFAYQVPLELPDGIDGWKPELSLAYSSLAPDGALGVGWTLTGIPAIARDPSYGTSLTDHDHFVFAGQRLVEEEQRSDGAFTVKEYRMEQDLSVLIEHYFNTSQDADYWKVTSRSGEIYYFGYADGSLIDAGQDGRIRADTAGHPTLVWSLNRASKRYQGADYYIFYDENPGNDNSGDYAPKEIRYGCTVGTTCTKTVEFSYTARGYGYTQYMPTPVRSELLLHTITVKIAGQLMKAYQLSYSKSPQIGRNLLGDVWEYGTVALSAPRQVAHFQYGGLGQHRFTKLEGNTLLKGGNPDEFSFDSGANVIPGDFNGDGNTDFIRQERGDWAGDSVNTFRVYYSNGDGTFDYAQPAGQSFYDWNGQPANAGHDLYQEDLRHVEIIPGDFNGDGKTDFLRKGSDLYLYLSLGGRSGQFKVCAAVRDEGIGSAKLAVGDFDGDGKQEFAAAQDGKPIRLYLNSGIRDGFFLPLNLTALPTANQQLLDLMAGDFDGDGKADLFYFKSDSFSGLYNAGPINVSKPYVATSLMSGPRVYEINGLMPDLWLGYTPTAYYNTYSAAHSIGDFNGDGRTDLAVLSPNYSNNTHSFHIVSYNPAASGGYSVQPMAPATRNLTGVLLTGDFDGDGIDDILDQSRSSYGQQDTYFQLYYSRGHNADGSRRWEAGTFGDDYQWAMHLDQGAYLILGDYNGDGRADFLRQEHGDWAHTAGNMFSLYLNGSDPTADLIQTATNETGGSIQAAYTLSTRLAGAIQPEQASGNLVPNAAPRPLVTQITYDFDGENTYRYDYAYSNGMFRTGYDPWQRRNLGFAQVTQTDTLGSRTETTYQWSLDGLDIRPLTQKVAVSRMLSETGALVVERETQYEYASGPLGGAAAITEPQDRPVNVVKETSKLYTLGTANFSTLETLYSHYDEYGNPGQVDYNGLTGEGGEADDYRVTYTYLKHTGTYPGTPTRSNLLGFPAEVTVWGKDPQHENLTVQQRTRTIYDYAGSDYDNNCNTLTRGLVTAVQQMNDAGQWVTVNRRSYDTANLPVTGLVRTVTDGNGNVTAVQYDAVYGDPVKITNALGQATVLEYDAYRRPTAEHYEGKPAAATKTYDVFSRLSTVMADEGDILQLTYADAARNGSGGFAPSCTYEKSLSGEASAGDVTHTTCIDGFGRVIQEKTSTGVSAYQTVDTYYRADPFTSKNGVKTSVPYTTNVKEFTARRIGPNSAAQLSTLQETYVSASQGLSRTNAVMTRVVNPDGTEQKTAVSSPLTTTVFAPNSTAVQSQTTLDGQGRTVALTRWEGGTVVSSERYAYFSGTGWKAQVTARSGAGGADIVTTMQYDWAGRGTTVADPDMGTWTYTYDTNGNLLSKTDAKGQRTTYSYDKLNRVLSVLPPAGAGVGRTDYYYDEPRDGYVNTGFLTTLKYDSNGIGGLDHYDYDKWGQVVKVNRKIDDKEKTQTYAYDRMGRLKQTNHTDGEQVRREYVYDRLNKLNGAGREMLASVSTNDFGEVSERQYGNGTLIRYGYETSAATGYTYLPSSIGVYPVAGGGALSQRTMGYDNRHRMTSYNGRTLSYDQQDRLTGDQQGAEDTRFRYDGLDNLTGKNNQAYTYDLARPHAVKQDGSFDYTYDANGNMTSRTKLEPDALPSAGGLVARWSMDESGGATLHDSSGNGNDATISGAVRVAGKWGGGLRFDGIDDFAALVSSATIPTGNASYTISAWFNPAELGAKGIIGWGAYNGATGQSNALRLSGCGLSHYWYFNDLNYTAPGCAAGLALNVWHHAAVEFDGTTRRMYVDGHLVAEDQPGSGHNVPFANFKIGKTELPVDMEYFKGILDEISIYNRALSETDIQALYQDNTTYELAPGLHTFSGSLASGVGYEELRPISTDYTNGFTWEGWVRFDNLSQGRKWLLEVSQGQDSNYFSILYDGHGDSGDLFLAYGPSWQMESFVPAPGILATNEWMHLAITLNQDPNHSGQYIGSVYKNGELYAVKNGLPAIATMTRSSNKLGKSNYNDTMLFQGQMKDVSLYAKALSVSELQSRYRKDQGRSYELVGGVQTFSGVAGSGVSQQVKEPELADFTQGFTWEGWVKYDADGLQANKRGYLNEYCNALPCTDWLSIFSEGQGGTGTLVLAYKSAATSQTFGSAVGILETGVWMHLGITVSPDHVVRMYKNGRQVYERSGLPPIQTVLRPVNRVGGPATSSSGNLFKGQMREVNLYTRALDPASMQLRTKEDLLAGRQDFTGTGSAEGTAVSSIKLGEAAYDFTGGFTWEGWVNFQPDTLQSGRHWLTEYATGADSNFIGVLYDGRGGSGDLSFVYGPSYSQQSHITASGLLTPNTWMHLAVTVAQDPASPGQYVATLYKDGQAVAEKRQMPAIPTLQRTSNYIGQSNYAGYAPFHGSMNRLHLYQTALGVGELQAIGEAGATDRRSFAYDSENRLIRVTDRIGDVDTVIASYAYDPFGERIVKQEGSRTRMYFFDDYEEVYANGSIVEKIKYYYGDEATPIAWELYEYATNAIKLYYLYKDHEGSVVEARDTGGQLVGSASYDAYGQPASLNGILPERLYTGHIYDQATGFYDYGARFYDPGLGKFITADSEASFGNLNRYTYANNSPFMFTDPDGHFPLAAIAFIIGLTIAVAGGITYGVGYVQHNQNAMIAGLVLMAAGTAVMSGFSGSLVSFSNTAAGVAADLGMSVVEGTLSGASEGFVQMLATGETSPEDMLHIALPAAIKGGFTGIFKSHAVSSAASKSKYVQPLVKMSARTGKMALRTRAAFALDNFIISGAETAARNAALGKDVGAALEVQYTTNMVRAGLTQKFNRFDSIVSTGVLSRGLFKSVYVGVKGAGKAGVKVYDHHMQQAEADNKEPGSGYAVYSRSMALQ